MTSVGRGARALVAEGTNIWVERPSGHHLYWPDLDVDLAAESIINPARYPLMSKVRLTTQLQLTSAAAAHTRRVRWRHGRVKCLNPNLRSAALSA